MLFLYLTLQMVVFILANSSPPALPALNVTSESVDSLQSAARVSTATMDIVSTYEFPPANPIPVQGAVATPPANPIPVQAAAATPPPNDPVLPPARYQPVLVKEYSGIHQAEFVSEYDRVRILAQHVPLEVSARLGLIQYQQGFRYPVSIRFQDVGGGTESALAYVSLAPTTAGFAQEMVINLSELLAHPMDFDTVFTHEMTHVVMNDAVGGEASAKIPHWAEEGLAIYISGEGDGRVKAVTQHMYRSQVHTLLSDLKAPVSGKAYPQYYLAIKYILDNHSINAVQAMVRDLIAGQSLTDAIRDSMGLSLEEFEHNVSEYSLKAFKADALQDGLQDKYEHSPPQLNPHGYKH